jgi:serine protease Do
VSHVIDGSPAAKAGIKAGDLVLRLDGAEVRDPYDLHERLSRTLPGTTVELTVVRQGEVQPVVAVELGEAGAGANLPG